MLMTIHPCVFLVSTQVYEDVSNHWNGIWNGTVAWKMEWNSECSWLQLTRVAGPVFQG